MYDDTSYQRYTNLGQRTSLSKVNDSTTRKPKTEKKEIINTNPESDWKLDKLKN